MVNPAAIIERLPFALLAQWVRISGDTLVMTPAFRAWRSKHRGKHVGVGVLTNVIASPTERESWRRETSGRDELFDAWRLHILFEIDHGKQVREFWFFVLQESGRLVFEPFTRTTLRR